MTTVSQQKNRHIIWSNLHLDENDWRDDYKDFIEMNELGIDPNDEEGLLHYMYETNNEYLLDERSNLDIQLEQPIVVIGNLGLWKGRVNGYKMIKSCNIKDCLYDNDCDYIEWYVDANGDLRADAIHHDGTNHYLYRVFKDGLSYWEINNFLFKIYCGKATRADITKYTKRLGDDIAKVYGFSIRKQRSNTERYKH